MRRRLALALLCLAACGPRHGAADLCLEATRRGPPAADLTCPEGTRPEHLAERRRAVDRFPGADGKMSAGRVVERRWCQGANGSLGPYVGLDARGDVIESGSYGAAGQPDGVWIVWDPRGRPAAVSRYREGRAESVRSCAPRQVPTGP